MRIIETARIVILIIRARVLLCKIGKIGFFTFGDSVENLFVFDENTAALRHRTTENVLRRGGGIIYRVAKYNALIGIFSRRNGIPALSRRTAKNTARAVGGIIYKVAS